MLKQEIAVLDHGYVALVDTMGDDRTPARTARTSFRNRDERTPEQDARLTNYLISHAHSTPVEFCQVRFYMKLPIFVARQIVRHRTLSLNEISYRYVTATREFYVPAPERMQRKATNNKQGSSSEIVEHPEALRSLIKLSGDNAFNIYEQLLAEGLAPELARTVLPVGTYTEWFLQQDLHNFLHFLKLRLDPHAQYEVRVYAEAMLALVEPIYPTIIAAWRKANAPARQTAYIVWDDRTATYFAFGEWVTIPADATTFATREGAQACLETCEGYDTLTVVEVTL